MRTPNATNLLSLQNTLETALAGDYLDEEESAMQSIRGSAAGAISPGLAQLIQRPWLRAYCKSVIGRTDLQNDTQMLQELYKYLHDNLRFVQSRGITFGTPAAGAGNQGNGQILRLTVDRFNYPIESEYIDSKRAICVADENTGTKRGREVWSIVGQARARDQLERSGSGLSGTLVGAIPDDSVIQNAAFRSFGGTAGSDAPTSLTNWTATDLTGAALTYNSTNFGIDTASGSVFRTWLGDAATPGSLVIKVSGRITQLLTSSKQTQLSSDVPYVMAVVWNRAINSASGTLNLRMGSLTTTVSVSGQTGWNVTTVPANIPLGQGCWYRQFARNPMQFQLEWIQTGGTGIEISEVLVIPGTQPLSGGTFYWAMPASVATYAQARVLDSFTWPDIATATSVIQTWIHRAWDGYYMPSRNGSSIGWADM